MFFLASKVLFLVLQPSSLAVAAILVGLVLARRDPRGVTGWRMAVGGVLFVLAAGFLPLGNALIYPLETRFGERQDAIPQPPLTGIVLLGGFEDGWMSAGRGGLGLNEAAERLTEGARLAHLFPGAKVVFTGGVGSLGSGLAAGEEIKTWLVAMGVAGERIVIEDKSRNTHENAVFTKELVQPKAGERWLLVTSAFHMPRSMGVFRQAGFEVTPFPVDFKTRDRGDVLRFFESIPRGLERVDLAAKEWIGLVAYRVTGRSAALFPAP